MVASVTTLTTRTGAAVRVHAFLAEPLETDALSGCSPGRTTGVGRGEQRRALPREQRGHPVKDYYNALETVIQLEDEGALTVRPETFRLMSTLCSVYYELDHARHRGVPYEFGPQYVRAAAFVVAELANYEWPVVDAALQRVD